MKICKGDIVEISYYPGTYYVMEVNEWDCLLHGNVSFITLHKELTLVSSILREEETNGEKDV